MRHNSTNPREKLIPLRRFEADNLYSAKYLSLLVQRKKLKAKKIGRNFYTTEKWFFDYLEKHARDEVRLKYKVIFSEKEKTIENRAKTEIGNWKLENTDTKIEKRALTGTIELSLVDVPMKLGLFNWLKNNIYKLGTAMFAVFFVALIASQLMIGQDARQGTISGVEEVNEEVATSSEAILINNEAISSSMDNN